MNPTEQHIAPDTPSSFDERLQKSICLILETAEAILGGESEEITLEHRLAAFRLISITAVPVYKSVQKSILEQHPGTLKLAALLRFREKLEHAFEVFLEMSDKLIEGTFGNMNYDQQLYGLRCAIRVGLPFLRMTSNPQSIRAAASVRTQSQTEEEYITELMDYLSMEDDLLNAPELDPQVRAKLLEIREEKIKNMGIFNTGDKPAPSSRPVSIQQPGKAVRTVQPQRTSAMQKPAPATSPASAPLPKARQSEPRFTRPVNPPHRYKPVQTESTPEQLDLIRFSIMKAPEPGILTPAELEKRFPLPDLYPASKKIVRSPYLRPIYRKASKPPASSTPNYHPDP